MRYLILILPFHSYDGKMTAGSSTSLENWIHLIKKLSNKIEKEDNHAKIKIIHSGETFAVQDARTIASKLSKKANPTINHSLRRHCNHKEALESILSPQLQMETDLIVITAHPETISCLVDFFAKDKQYSVADKDTRYVGYVVDCIQNQIKHVPLTNG